jgi:hypothetical protein
VVSWGASTALRISKISMSSTDSCENGGSSERKSFEAKHGCAEEAVSSVDEAWLSVSVWSRLASNARAACNKRLDVEYMILRH